MRYGVLAAIEEDEKSVSKLRQQAGCFVMLTNVDGFVKNHNFDFCSS